MFLPPGNLNFTILELFVGKSSLINSLLDKEGLARSVGASFIPFQLSFWTGIDNVIERRWHCLYLRRDRISKCGPGPSAPIYHRGRLYGR